MGLIEKRKKLLNQNRLKLFCTEKNYYLYDAYSQNIYPVNKICANFFSMKKNEYSDDEENQLLAKCDFLLKWDGKIKYVETDVCHLTINLSNKCNLNCTYCYREKNNKFEMNEEVVKEILTYAKSIYMPNAKEIVSSMNLTSEPLLELDKLKRIKAFYKDFEDKNTFLTMWFMSNGTILTDESIQFIKDLKISPFWISLDGPDFVHNKHRKYYDNKNSYEDVINNINLLKINNIKVRISCVITRNYPFPDKLFDFFKTLEIDSIQMTPVRNGLPESISEQALNEIKIGYSNIFDKICNEVLNDDFSSIRLLRDDILMSTFKNIFQRVRQSSRCTWGKEIVIDSKGDIYPCLYVINNQKFKLGNIRENKNSAEILFPITVNQRKKCSKCWGRFLCGGTCHYNSISLGKTEFDVDEIECEIRYFLIEESLKRLIYLMEKKCNLTAFSKSLI